MFFLKSLGCAVSVCADLGALRSGGKDFHCTFPRLGGVRKKETRKASIDSDGEKLLIMESRLFKPMLFSFCSNAKVKIIFKGNFYGLIFFSLEVL